MLPFRVTLFLAVSTVLVIQITAPPVLPNEAESKPKKTKETDSELGLMYEHYLRQVIEYLEQDEAFKEKLGSANMDDITSGKIANELHFVDRNIRSRLDELKRKELHRLRMLARREHELSNGLDRRNIGWPQHVDVQNPHTFEIEDLKKLVQQTTRDLEELDRKRRDDFKKYEMDKEHRRREALEKMDEDHRKKAEKEYDEAVRRHKEHPRLHHPGSKQQLEEVWEKEDKLPTDEFNPKVFFKMHDLDEDDFWDEEEIKSLFRRELDKMYEQNNTDDDMQERLEEMDRMREHVVNETDTNHDGLISLEEFLDMTKRNEFNQDPGWEGLDEQQLYEENELREYERQLQMGMVPQNGVPVYVPGGVHPGGQYQHVPPGQYIPQDQLYQQHPNHVYQDSGYRPQPQYQQQPGGVPHQQYQQPGGVPQQQYQQFGGVPQQQYQQPGGVPQQQYQQQPGGAPQQPYRQAGGVPQQQYQQQPGGVPQQQYQQQPGGVPQQQYQQPGGIPQYQQPPGAQQQQYQQPAGVQQQAGPSPNAIPNEAQKQNVPGSPQLPAGQQQSLQTPSQVQSSSSEAAPSVSQKVY